MVFMVSDILLRRICDEGETLSISNVTGTSTDVNTDVVTPIYTTVTTKAIITFVSDKQARLVAQGYKPALDILVQVPASTTINLGSKFTWNSEEYIVDRQELTRFEGNVKEQTLICKRYN